MKFDYGDEVVLRVPKDVAGGAVDKLCVVVSITPIETEQQAQRFARAVGEVLYTVEFGDGSDLLVPETDLFTK
jgi:hypothetical protein